MVALLKRMEIEEYIKESYILVKHWGLTGLVPVQLHNPHAVVPAPSMGHQGLPPSACHLPSLFPEHTTLAI